MKSAYELAMERFKKSDAESGIERKTLTDDQKAAIAEIRRVYQAKLAEIEILHKGRIRGMLEPSEYAAVEDEYQRERARLNSERDGKIDRVRNA